MTRLGSEHGADYTSSTLKNFTPLHLVAQEGNAAVAAVLIENGADFKAVAIKNFTHCT